MYFFQLTLLYSLLTVSAVDAPVKPIATPEAPRATNIIYQSKDGGQTWEDVSYSLPESVQPEGFFSGASEIYVRTNGLMYRSKSNLKTPVWEKVNVIDQKSTITFNKSGVLAYSYDGKIYQKKNSTDSDNSRWLSGQDWLPAYPNLKSNSVATIFEAADGSLFLGTGKSLSKSTDNAQSWKVVQKVWVGDIVESNGVLLATGQKGIMRSTDGGDNWEWVISEGGVGIAIEQIQDGFAAIAYNTETKSRRIHISKDNGKTWQTLEGLPPSATISSIKQVGRYLLCGHPDGIFRSSDLGKSWTRVHSSVDQYQFQFLKIGNTDPLNDQRKVFKIHVSGSVVYAVAVNSGC
jgi:photosystem II stability/assembly factor-like uncharacterized protein